MYHRIILRLYPPKVSLIFSSKAIALERQKQIELAVDLKRAFDAISHDLLFQNYNYVFCIIRTAHTCLV